MIQHGSAHFAPSAGAAPRLRFDYAPAAVAAPSMMQTMVCTIAGHTPLVGTVRSAPDRVDRSDCSRCNQPIIREAGRRWRVSDPVTGY